MRVTPENYANHMPKRKDIIKDIADELMNGDRILSSEWLAGKGLDDEMRVLVQADLSVAVATFLMVVDDEKLADKIRAKMFVNILGTMMEEEE